MDHQPLPPPQILQRVVDVHCHPTDNDIPDECMEALQIKICSMASRANDQERVRRLATRWPDKVTPCFGYHPWCSHQISLMDPPAPKREHYVSLLLSNEPSVDDSDKLAFEEVLENLPEPTSLATVLDEIRGNLMSFPNALLGEVGLDRAFRIPIVPYPADRVHSKRLSPFYVPKEHQEAILEAQIDLAIELRRSISLHSVKSHQATVDLLKSLRKRHGKAFGSINIDLHSCGLSSEMCRDVQKDFPNVFLSLSIVINGRSPHHESVVRACVDDRLLAESDYNSITECTSHTWDMVHRIAEIKGWSVEEDIWDDDNVTPEGWGVVRRLESNWRRFIGPGLGLARPKKKKQKRHDFVSDSDDENEEGYMGQ